jgi:hypothetical protein
MAITNSLRPHIVLVPELRLHRLLRHASGAADLVQVTDLEYPDELAPSTKLALKERPSAQLNHSSVIESRAVSSPRLAEKRSFAKDESRPE